MEPAKEPSKGAQYLADLVRLALRRNKMNGHAMAIEPGTSNFAVVPQAAAMELKKLFWPEPTSSHSKAWQYLLPEDHYAIKLYWQDGVYWHIAIVTTGWRHAVDELIYHHAPKFWSRALNLRNALYWRAHL